MATTKQVKPVKVEEIKGETLELGITGQGVAEVSLNVNNPPMEVKGLRLNIGCGDDYKEGFLNIDPYDKDADIKAFGSSIPLKDRCAGQIIAYDVLEHIGFNDILPTLKEWHRLLVQAGKVHLIIPDVVGVCEDVAKNPDNEWNFATLYGNQSHDGQFHKSCFTPKTIFRYLGYAGFRGISVARFTYGNAKCLYVEGQK